MATATASATSRDDCCKSVALLLLLLLLARLDDAAALFFFSCPAKAACCSCEMPMATSAAGVGFSSAADKKAASALRDASLALLPVCLDATCSTNHHRQHMYRRLCSHMPSVPFRSACHGPATQLRSQGQHTGQTQGHCGQGEASPSVINTGPARGVMGSMRGVSHQSAHVALQSMVETNLQMQHG